MRNWLAFVLISVFLSGPAVADTKPSLVMFAYDIVDLTHAFDAETLYWPTAPGFALDSDFEGTTERSQAVRGCG